MQAYNILITQGLGSKATDKLLYGKWGGTHHGETLLAEIQYQLLLTQLTTTATHLPPRLVPPTRSIFSREWTSSMLTPEPMFTCRSTQLQ